VLYLHLDEDDDDDDDDENEESKIEESCTELPMNTIDSTLTDNNA